MYVNLCERNENYGCTNSKFMDVNFNKLNVFIPPMVHFANPKFEVPDYFSQSSFLVFE